MTPFNLTIENELDIERQRFENKWLFPWHKLNMQGKHVDVEDFRGGRFHVGGIKFEGQISRYVLAGDRALFVGENQRNISKLEDCK